MLLSLRVSQAMEYLGIVVKYVSVCSSDQQQLQLIMKYVQCASRVPLYFDAV